MEFNSGFKGLNAFFSSGHRQITHDELWQTCWYSM